MPVIPQQQYQQQSESNKPDNDKINKFENELSKVNMKYDNLNGKMDQLLVFIQNTNSSTNNNTNNANNSNIANNTNNGNTNSYNPQQQQMRDEEMSVFDDDEPRILNKKYFLRGSTKRNKFKRNNKYISRHKHEHILWSAINSQSGNVTTLASCTGYDPDTIRTSFRYWHQRNMMAKHGHNSHTLIIEFKQQNIKLNNKFIKRLRSVYGEFEFEQSSVGEQVDSDGQSESEFFMGDTESSNEFSLHALFIYFLQQFWMSILFVISKIFTFKFSVDTFATLQETDYN